MLAETRTFLKQHKKKTREIKGPSRAGEEGRKKFGAG